MGILIGMVIVVEFINWVLLPITLQIVETRSSDARRIAGESAAAVAKKREDAKADLETELARINTARAPFANRVRQAEVRKKVAESQIAALAEQLRTSTVRAEVISTRVKDLENCAKRYFLSMDPGDYYDFGIALASAYITRGASVRPFVIMRRQCTPEDTTPQSMIHGNAK